MSPTSFEVYKESAPIGEDLEFLVQATKTLESFFSLDSSLKKSIFYVIITFENNLFALEICEQSFAKRHIIAKGQF